MIIGITGTLGAGKGTVVDYLKTKGFRHYSARSVITEEIVRRGLPVNRDTMTVTANDMRRLHGATYPQKELYERAIAEGAKDAIIESVRSIEGAKFLKEKGGVLFIVDADPQVRYARIVERGSETDQVDFATFKAQEERERTSDDPNHQNLAGVALLADYRIENNGALEDLHRQIDEALADVRRDAPVA